MYSRSSNRQRTDRVRYNPPPGYVGNAFADTGSIKHHAPETDISASENPVWEGNSGTNTSRMPRRPTATREERAAPPIVEIPPEQYINRVPCSPDDPANLADAPMNRADGQENHASLLENAENSMQNSVEASAGKSMEKSAGKTDSSPILQLIESLRGKIGTEELIILLVMLLISADGVGVEEVVLGLALLAG